MHINFKRILLALSVHALQTHLEKIQHFLQKMTVLQSANTISLLTSSTRQLSPMDTSSHMSELVANPLFFFL